MCAVPNTTPRRQFPTAFTILFFIMLLAIALTWIIPAGAYSKLSYNPASATLMVNSPQGDISRIPATQDALANLNINIAVEQFTNGTIRKPIAIPGTYARLEQTPKGLGDVAVSMVKGTIEGADIIVFILVLGGLIGVINKTGAFSAGLVALSRKTRGNEFLFVALVCFVMALGGTTCGLEEEAVEAFTQGASELVAVSLIIGLARGVNLVLDQGMISDTILAYASDLVSGMHGAVFAVSQMLVFALLGLVVPSSSGLAVLSMPIMAPLADTVMIPRYIVVSAYNWGQYAMLFLAPTGLVLVTLQMLGIQFNKWVKFVLPMVGFVLGFGALLLVVQVMLA